MDVYVRWPVNGIKYPLVFLDWSESQYDEIMH